MSHKIQIDLCEIFGVKEGQEFSIDKTKYKIENNILQTGFGDFWVKNEKTLSWLCEKHEIQIGKSTRNSEFQTILGSTKKKGYKRFGFKNRVFTFYATPDRDSMKIKSEKVTDKWCKNILDKNSNGSDTYFIKNYL